MMQGVAVKYHDSVLWYINSLVSEVLGCAMGRGHPKWSVNTLNLPKYGENGQYLATPVGYVQCYLFDDCPNVWEIGLVIYVGPPFTSYNSIQLLISLGSDMWMRGYESKKPLDDARCLRRICEIF